MDEMVTQEREIGARLKKVEYPFIPKYDWQVRFA